MNGHFGIALRPVARSSSKVPCANCDAIPCPENSEGTVSLQVSPD